MGQLYFHCSNGRDTLIDPRGAAIADLAQARDHARSIVRSLLRTRRSEDWRRGVLHVRNSRGDKIFVMPFTFVLGEQH